MSDEYSTNADKSIKLTRLNTGLYWFLLKVTYSPSYEEYGKNVTFSADVLNKLNGASLMQIISDSQVSINIPKSNEFKPYSVSNIINSNSLNLYIGFAGEVLGALFIDNLNLTIS